MSLITKIKNHSELLMGLLLMVYFFATPFSVSSVFQKILPGLPSSLLISSGVCFGLIILYMLTRKSEKYRSYFPQDQKRLIYIFVIPIVFSIIITAYNFNTLISVEYKHYVQSDMIKRLINYFIFITIFFIATQVISSFKESTIRKIVWAYLASLFLLVFFGIWQFLHFTMDVPFVNISTRSFIHSVSGLSLFNFRLTSYADEPSYLVPFLIDFLVIGFVMFQSKIKYGLCVFLPTILVIVLSYSVSGYVNLLALIFIGIVLIIFSNIKNKRYIFYIIIGLFVLCGIFYLLNPVYVREFLEPITGRFSTIFDFQNHRRMYMYVMPFIWLFDHTSITSIFGYGPGAYEFLHSSKMLPYSTPVSTTSNNMFVDIIFEHGLFGVLILIIGLGIWIFKLFKWRSINNYYMFSFYLLAHLIVTSLYRGDFVTPRFWGICLIIFMFLELGRRKKESNNQQEE